MLAAAAQEVSRGSTHSPTHVVYHQHGNFILNLKYNEEMIREAMYTLSVTTDRIDTPLRRKEQTHCEHGTRPPGHAPSPDCNTWGGLQVKDRRLGEYTQVASAPGIQKSFGGKVIS